MANKQTGKAFVVLAAIFVVFALGCGVITFIIRYFCAYPEGVSFSILIMNILTPFIEKWTAKEPLGGVK